MNLTKNDRKRQRRSPTKAPQGINLWEDGRPQPDVRRMIAEIIEAVDGKYLTRSQKVVLRKMMWLDRYVDKGCYATAGYIGKLVCMSARTVCKHRTALVKKGLLRKEQSSWFFVWPLAFPPALFEITENTTEMIPEWAGRLNEYLATPGSKQVYPQGQNRYMGGSKQVLPYIREYTGVDTVEGSDEPSFETSFSEEPNTGEQTNHSESPAEGGVVGIPRGKQPDTGDAEPTLREDPTASSPGVTAPRVPTALPKPKVSAKQPNWITEAGEAWKAAYGGTVPYGRIGKALKPLADDHTTAEILATWERYLKSADGQFASAERFASTYGSWKPKQGLKELRDPLNDTWLEDDVLSPQERYEVGV